MEKKELGDFKLKCEKLLTEFNSYDEKDIRIILQFCGNSYEKSRDFLKNTTRKNLRNTIRKFAAGEIEAMPDVEEDIMNSKNIEETKSSDIFIPDGPNLFALQITKDEIFCIFDFLDPYSLSKISRVCKQFNQIAKHNLLYRKFCLANYRSIPKLPESSPFNSMIPKIVNAAPGEFSNLIINQAKTDIRSLIWVPELKHYQTPSNYFKQHKDYRDLYLKGPRLRFGGVYMMRETYVRIGMRMMNQQYDPQHLVEFFRYLRFFPDGFVISCLSVKKLTNEKLIKLFKFIGNDYEQEEYGNSNIKSIMSGEFIVKKNILFVKLATKTTIFETEMEISSSSPGAFDELKPISQKMRVIGIEEGSNIQNEQQSEKSLKFIRIPNLINDLPLETSAIYI